MHDDKIENQQDIHISDQHRAIYISKQKHHIAYPTKTPNTTANNTRYYAYNDYASPAMSNDFAFFEFDVNSVLIYELIAFFCPHFLS